MEHLRGLSNSAADLAAQRRHTCQVLPERQLINSYARDGAPRNCANLIK